ncbi:MAG TPA: PilC/PilY family type IV pilus protein [Burkholderiaceae bacterium]|jgi:type IV pilus assembly protein PilY1
MKRYLNHLPVIRYQLLSLVLAMGFALPLPALAASVSLATAPLATATNTVIKPNVLFVLDDSGSMTWTYLPDAADNFRGDYGYHSSHCNAIYYNPAITYLPPLDANKVAYADASFTAAKDNGFDSATTARDLNTQFIANRFVPDAANTTYSSYGSYSGGTSLGPYRAFYYAYSGTQTTPNFANTGSTFYTECNTAIGSATSVFSKRTLSGNETTTITVSGSNSTSVSHITVNGVELMSGTSTANATASTVAANIAAKITMNGFTASASGTTITITGPTSAANYTPVITIASGTMTLTPDVFPDTSAASLTNFANWYSYYRTRMQMMKTSAGRAFSVLDNNYRVGLMKINSSSSPTVAIDVFETTQRSNWYTSFYNTVPNNSTPLREALSNAGLYYAGLLTGTTDPLQYSCQQNFTILSTDGYWNGNAGFKLDGSTAVGNQDGTYGRPYNDGAQASTTVTITYTRNSYAKKSSTCTGGKKQLQTQPQIGSCNVSVTTVTGSESCTPSSWSNNGAATLDGICTNTAAPSPSNKVKVSAVTSPGSTGGTSDTLADVAMYYYQTDLRTSALGNCGAGNTLCTNNVFTSATDSQTQQHMTTFTLGLGGSGRMLYSSSYLTGGSADYQAVLLGSTASGTVCTWQTSGTVCTWPVPGSDQVENIDDLWHAAVNGHGAYFSATDPTSLSAGLSNALAGINSRKGSAAAAATSTLNPVAGNNYAYVASYTTVSWKGNLEARGINTDTGVVDVNASWCVQDITAGTCASPGSIVADTSGDTTIYNCVTPNSVVCTGGVLDGTDCKVQMATACTGTMDSKVTDVSDTRTIKTANSSGTALIDFDSAYATANPGYFNAAQISTLSQWISLTTAQQTAAAGTNLINYLRGQNGYEDRNTNAAANRLYRAREAVLGDALESQPAFLSKPVFSYPYPGYSAFVTAQAGRAGTVFMGANDGMMHAFAADTGIERWAYVPSMVIPNMWKLADKNYGTAHANFVNGSPVTTDICTANCTDAATAVWKTILVAGLNGGGRGYYALDITTPNSPALLWEFTTSGGIGTHTDDDLGYSFGKPIVTRKADGTWVVLVTSGYNNTSPGNGRGYLYVLNAATGAIISKISTGVGDTTTPSGLAKIAGWNNEPVGNLVGYVYGGDLLGNVWRFDINGASTAAIGTGNVLKFATLFSDTAGTSPQPITTTPVLGKIVNKRVIFIGTGKYLESSDLSTTQKQSEYAIKDDEATTTLINPRNTLVNQTLGNNPNGTATRLTTSSATVDFTTGQGWYIDFPDSGERVNIDSQLVLGTLLIPTIVPSTTDCSPGGYGWLNFVDYTTGKAIDTTTNLVSSKYDSTIVGINVLYIDGKPVAEVVTSTDPTPQIDKDTQFKAVAPVFTGKRVIWRELMQ